MKERRILLYPIHTEKTSIAIEKENKLEFKVPLDATKKEIKEAVEKKYGVKVAKINTRIDRNGKRALIKLAPPYKAEEIGMKIGVM
ncbi:MAG: 50S ribosomal protein L23 [Thermoplasmata archaeon]|nr:50S ribosomal protein L23 [Thermoplasmata archaeon]